MAADIMNGHITALDKEKIWTSPGPEFGQDKGQKALLSEQYMD